MAKAYKCDICGRLFEGNNRRKASDYEPLRGEKRPFFFYSGSIIGLSFEYCSTSQTMDLCEACIDAVVNTLIERTDLYAGD